MDPIKNYLKSGILPYDADEAGKVKRPACNYVLNNDVLYKARGGEAILKCIDRSEAFKVLNELHKGICESHNGDRTMGHWVMPQGYFWLYLMKDGTK